MPRRILIVGAGFSGAVAARETAIMTGKKVLVTDRREHVAGNCHTERDPDTNVMVHRYGPHIFNTSNEEVWNYVQQFGVFHQFINRVKACNSRGVFSMPINLHTINQFFGQRFRPDEALSFVGKLGDRSVKEPRNFEEQALKMLGRELYEAFFYGYTKKQWGCDPKELPASILKRLPIRFNYNDNYYASTYQGIPADGYTEIIRRVLDHPNIEVKLNSAYDPAMRDDFEHLIFTGPIDEFFDFRLGRLGYRTVFWERSVYNGDFQGNAVINYTDVSEPFTRVHEHKHFAPWEKHENTSVFVEFSKETASEDIPYYPKRLAPDLSLLESYKQLAREESGVSFLGRLATYRYMDMDDVIAEAMEFAKSMATSFVEGTPPPIFPNTHA